MKIVKYKAALKFSNSKYCTGIEYPTEDKEIDFSIATIKGRYPDKGYCVNTECKELIYVIDGTGTLYKKTGTLYKKEEEISFEKGDVILIDRKEMYYWESFCTIAMACTPAWYPEQHQLIEIDKIKTKEEGR